MTREEKMVLVKRLEKLTAEQLMNQMEKTNKEVKRLEELEKYYREKNEKDPHLKFYNLEPYRIWQGTLKQIERIKEALEVGKEVLNRKVEA